MKIIRSKIGLGLIATMLILILCSCETQLPYREITYNPEQGYVLSKDSGQAKQYMRGDNLMLDRQGIGTVVIYDTLRCGQHEIIGYENVAEIPFRNFSLTAVGEYTVLVLDRGNSKTWSIDLNQCCVILRYAATGLVSLFADPNCPGLKIP